MATFQHVDQPQFSSPPRQRQKLSTIPASTSPSSILRSQFSTTTTPITPPRTIDSARRLSRPPILTSSSQVRQTRQHTAVPPPSSHHFHQPSVKDPNTHWQRPKNHALASNISFSEAETERNFNTWSADTTPVKNDERPFSLFTGISTGGREEITGSLIGGGNKKGIRLIGSAATRKITKVSPGRSPASSFKNHSSQYLHTISPAVPDVFHRLSTSTQSQRHSIKSAKSHQSLFSARPVSNNGKDRSPFGVREKQRRRPSLPLSFIASPSLITTGPYISGSTSASPLITTPNPSNSNRHISHPILLSASDQRDLSKIQGFESMSIRSERLSARGAGELRGEYGQGSMGMSRDEREYEQEENAGTRSRRNTVTRANGDATSTITPPPLPITPPSSRMRALASTSRNEHPKTPSKARQSQTSAISSAHNISTLSSSPNPQHQQTIGAAGSTRSRKPSSPGGRHAHRRAGSGSSGRKSPRSTTMAGIVKETSRAMTIPTHPSTSRTSTSKTLPTVPTVIAHGSDIDSEREGQQSSKSASRYSSRTVMKATVPPLPVPSLDKQQNYSLPHGNGTASQGSQARFNPTEAFGMYVPPGSATQNNFRNSIATDSRGGVKSLGRAGGKTATSGMSKAETDALEERALGGKTLAGLYLVSGLTKDVKMWSMSDTEAMKRVQPAEDSLGCYWRPEVLGKSWAGQEKSSSTGARSPPQSAGPGSSVISSMSQTSEMGTPAMMRVIAKALKMAHLKEVEIINAEVAPQASTHPFTFVLPEDPAPSGFSSSVGRHKLSHSAANEETQWHGLCLTVWTPADPDRSKKLNQLKNKLKKLVAAGDSIYGFDNGVMLGTGSTATITPLARMSQASLALSPRARGRKPSNMRIGIVSGYSSAAGDDSDSMMSESDLEGPFSGNFRGHPTRSRLHNSIVADVAEEMAGDAGALFEHGEDRFWIPYALTLVSRHPIYDIMGDFLKLSWARFSKDFTSHSRQIARILSYNAPRAGQSLRLLTGLPGEADIELCGEMPGGGIGPSTEMRAWIIFAMLPVDSVLTIIEIALSNSGKVIVMSKCANAVGHFVIALHGMLRPYRWSGIAMPAMHARDVTMLLDAPAPYLIGLDADCKDVVGVPTDAICVDLDTHQLRLPALVHEGVLSKGPHREKYRSYLTNALGPDRSQDFGVPAELKSTFSNGKMRPTSTVNVSNRRPAYLGDDIRPPRWWNGLAIRQAIDRIMAEKARKPGFFQKLLSGGPPKPEAPLTVGEISAKDSMRQRALAAVESRDMIELKIGRINRRLIHLIQEGEVWKKRFEDFEAFTEKLGAEALELKTKIEKEKREAKRLSGMVTSKQHENSELQNRLQNTEKAREEALLRLSDMAANMQALELERDTIVDTIELQLDNVMTNLDDGLHSDTGSDDLGAGPTSPSPRRAVPSGRPRASTGRSSLRARQTNGHPAKVSVIDAMGGPDAGNKRFSLVTMEDGKDNMKGFDAKTSAKSELISERMAKIQRKLDAAMEAVSAHRLASADDAEESPSTHDPVADPNAAPPVDQAQTNAIDGHVPNDNLASEGQYLAIADPQDSQMPASLSSRTLVEVPVTVPAAGKRVHKVGSHSVLATITTVITMDDHAEDTEDDGREIDTRSTARIRSGQGQQNSGISRPPRRSPSAKASSRFSLLPPTGSGDYAALSKIEQLQVVEDEEYLESEVASEGDSGGRSSQQSKVSPDHHARRGQAQGQSSTGRRPFRRTTSSEVPSSSE